MGETPQAGLPEAGPRWAVALLLVASLALFGWGLTWGLPSQFGWAPDELLPQDVLDGLSVGFAQGWHGKYPPFHFYALSLAYAPILLARGWGPGQALDAGTYHALFVLGRVASLSMGAGLVLLAWRAALELGGRKAAFFTAAIVATSLPVVFYAKLANLDVPYLFWFALSLLCLTRCLTRDRRRDLVAFAVASVLAVATKDQAIGLYVLTVPTLLFMRWRRRRVLLDGDVLVAGAAALGAFAATFTLFFNWDGFVGHVRVLSQAGVFRLFPNTPAGRAALCGQALANLRFCLGAPAFWACLSGIAWALAKPGAPRRLLPLLVPAVSYYLFLIAPVGFSYDRFLLPIALLLAFFGGRLLADLSDAPSWKGRCATAAGALVLAWGLARGVSLDLQMARDARYSAERWLADNVREDQTVAGIGRLTELPRLDALRWSVLPPSAGELAQARPDYVVVNADLARRSREGSGREAFYARLDDGRAGYVEVLRLRFRAPWLAFESERLAQGGYGSVISNLERVNPEIVVYRRTP